MEKKIKISKSQLLETIKKHRRIDEIGYDDDMMYGSQIMTMSKHIEEIRNEVMAMGEFLGTDIDDKIAVENFISAIDDFKTYVDGKGGHIIGKAFTPKD